MECPAMLDTVRGKSREVCHHILYQITGIDITMPSALLF
jgi:hypothetical protein